MRATSTLFCLAGFAAPWLAVAVVSYAPTYSTCPSTALVRHAGTVGAKNQSLNSAEAAYIEARRSEAIPSAYKEWYANVAAALECANSTLPYYVKYILTSGNESALPRLSIAVSGGGYRAAIVGAGVLTALDGRSAVSVGNGTGGVLQAAEYIAGLSGGSWLVTSLAQANFPTLRDLILGASSADGAGFGGWLTDYDVFTPSNSSAGNAAFYKAILTDMSEKYAAGFQVSIADFWARALSYHFVNGTSRSNFFNSSASHGRHLTFSSIARTKAFVAHAQPYPIITALARSNGENASLIEAKEAIPLSNTQYEFTVHESGSWDANLAHFINTTYLGTSMSRGSPTNSSACVRGLENAGYLLGTSSNLFTELNVTQTAEDSSFFNSSSIAPIAVLINATFGALEPHTSLDTSPVPNPFYGLGSSSYLDRDETTLRLVDGGIDGEIIPFAPLIVPARRQDVIIAIDASADTDDNYAAGLALSSTANRSALYPTWYPFPQIPSLSEFTALDLPSHPTFFGCDDSNAPLVVWIANSAPLDGSAGVTNTTTTALEYPASQVEAMLVAAAELGYRGFPPPKSEKHEDPVWPACLACAVTDRARGRLYQKRSGLCASCFDRYCWRKA